MLDIALIPGDGIGPEVTEAARRVIDALGIPINWHTLDAGGAQIPLHGTPLPPHVVEEIRKYGTALKGPITTPVGTGFRSVNVVMRVEMDLYANVRPARTFPGVPSRYEGVDLVVIRENTEDVYVGVEHMVGRDAAESIKIFTRRGCERIIRYAFEYAARNGRRKVTAVHKANIMKCTDGMFLAIARQMASEYPGIQFEDAIVDALCMRLVQEPEVFDVLVLPNLYGDIVSDLCAGLGGGLGLAPSANIGENAAIFEAVHGSAPAIAGQNIANPAALILSGALMLRHLGLPEAAIRMENAIASLIRGGCELTRDLCGNLGTREFADAVIARLNG